ncbi:hypothetical protein Nepgr_025019 [Nepenthes gracilis]|uniref:lipid IVA 3-deoxy-D-manno-octulosonic acid transferase n=1 Tax=Nepenthes gracilis TaxID=150966 RepID=A0AAD3Y126_NEPGR|nr:hypothetical protein Nepgr_025019 [Nepenthes gracilis]
MSRERGKLVYKCYRALTTTLSPLLQIYLRWRKFRGLEHPTRWPERLGRASLPRPPGLLIWFHAVSLGEGMAAIPVIRSCVRKRPDLNILMTTTTVSAFEVLRNQLPSCVIYQFAPIDAPASLDAFLGHWKPNAIILVESELWPNLIMGASKSGIMLALINARISTKSLKRWSLPISYPLITLMLSKFALIVPLSMTEAIHFQLLQAPPFVISFSVDLKYAVEECETPKASLEHVGDLQVQLLDRMVWMASSIHKGEEKVILGVHEVLVQRYPNMVTIIVPRHPQHGQDIALELKTKGLNVAVRSHHDELTQRTNIYLVDTLGELRCFYRLATVAVVGGSFLPGLAGHNISEAAAAGCAVVIGPHIGQFSHMVSAMQRLNPLAVIQVSSKVDLISVLSELFGNPKILEARRSAAKQAFHSLSSGVVAHVWNLLSQHVLYKLFAQDGH